jgi:hypothetical protein
MSSPESSTPSAKRVFLAGEGSCELGSWSNEPAYQDDGSPGVLKTLLEKVKSTGWEIKGARRWKSIRGDSAVKPIRRYRTGVHLKPEEQTVRGACMLAKTNGCDVLAFTRDIDGDSDYNRNRKRDIESGIVRASAEYPSVKIIGGCARPAIEGWVLAFSGERGTEGFSKARAEEKLSEKGIAPKNTGQMVAHIRKHNRTDVADDAVCLIRWLDTAGDIV